MAGYGEVGVNVGSVGRWTRFVLGILIIVFVATDFYPVTHAHSAASFLMMVLSVALAGWVSAEGERQGSLVKAADGFDLWYEAFGEGQETSSG